MFVVCWRVLCFIRRYLWSVGRQNVLLDFCVFLLHKNVTIVHVDFLIYHCPKGKSPNVYWLYRTTNKIYKLLIKKKGHLIARSFQQICSFTTKKAC